jgi:pyridoxine 4-dehydrogenase
MHLFIIGFHNKSVCQLYVKKGHTLDELGIDFVPYSRVGIGYFTETINENTKLADNDFRNLISAFNRKPLKQTKR